MAFDDMAAFGAAQALRSVGLRIPDDCSVIGFDDIPAAAFFYPSLTTVREGMQELGSMGAEILLGAMEARHQKKPFDAVQRKVEPELVVRESTGVAKA
jgi:LacI family transcriptional regulator